MVETKQKKMRKHPLVFFNDVIRSCTAHQALYGKVGLSGIPTGKCMLRPPSLSETQGVQQVAPAHAVPVQLEDGEVDIACGENLPEIFSSQWEVLCVSQLRYVTLIRSA